jgi:DNA-binding transcriptional LysR family regulator
VAAILPPVVEQLSGHAPGVVLRISDLVAPTVDVPQLRDRTLDLALLRVVGSPAEHRYGDDLNVEVLFNDEARVVAGKGSRWARRRKIDLAELAGEPWILPPVNSLNRKVVVDAFRARGLDPPKISLETFSVQLRANLLASGRYLTVFPRSMMGLYADQMSLQVLPIKLPRTDWPVVIVTLKNRMLNPVAQLFIKQVRTTMRSLAA